MSSHVKIAVAQINSTVGDLQGNCRRILEFAQRAASAGADVLLTPELSLTGYPPEDLLVRGAFHAAIQQALAGLCEGLANYPNLHVLVGYPMQVDSKRFNAASLIVGGSVRAAYCKHDLPNYDVFDEQRYFTPDHQPLVFEVGGTKLGVAICEDTWFPYVPERARAAGAQVLLVLNASPYHLEKTDLRFEKVRAHVSPLGLAAVYANLVGGQDELVFDGASFALDHCGEVTHMAAQFKEDLLEVEVKGGVLVAGRVDKTAPTDEQVYCALVLGVRDYVDKNGFPGAILGLSGGIDSALTLAIAVDALGAQRVRAVMMPSRYTADISMADANDMAARFAVRLDVWPIGPMFDTYLAALAQEFEGLAWDSTEENIQARIRGNLLMALSNKTGSIVLTTGNKSEMAVGYCTLYGDMAGGFAVLKDLRKAWVYRLARWRNQRAEVIPPRIIERAPSAELRENQTDQDTLPPYEVLDAIIALYMEQGASLGEILAVGFDPQHARQVVRLIRTNEYKRRQAPVGVRITHRAFGRDWRYPITNKFFEESLPSNV